MSIFSAFLFNLKSYCEQLERVWTTVNTIEIGKYYGQLERLVEHKENIVDVRKDRTKKTVKTMDIGKNYGHI